MNRRQNLQLLLAGPWAALAHAQPEPLVLTGSKDMRDSYYGEWLRLIYTDAARRLGRQLDYRVYPSRRAAVMAKAGEVDGEINRYADYDGRAVGQIRVDESHFTLRFAAYAIGDKAPLKSWEGLRHTPYLVEYCTGVAAAEAALPAILPAQQISHVQSILMGLRKLVFRRTDIFIDIEGLVDPYLRQEEFHTAGIRKLGIVEERAFHAFVRADQAELAHALARALREMKQSGLIERYREQALRDARRQTGRQEPPPCPVGITDPVRDASKCNSFAILR
ncbi:MAG: transporter substrate-binding domain-containing protein [Burkholderiaceae bacterium]|nr:transporter substrate-binding domain-containing protein [Burkholderiaceae bacterium]